MTLNNSETILAIRNFRISARVLSKYINGDRITGDGAEFVANCLIDHQYDLCVLANRLEKELDAKPEETEDCG